MKSRGNSPSNKSNAMCFYEFMRKYKDSSSVGGQLAREMERDGSFPCKNKFDREAAFMTEERRQIYDYFQECKQNNSVHPDLFRIFKKYWAEYEHYMFDKWSFS